MPSNLPSSVQGQGDFEIGEDGPEEGLDEADGESDQRGGEHEGPGWEEEIVPLLEENWHAINGKCPAGRSPSDQCLQLNRALWARQGLAGNMGSQLDENKDTEF